MAPQIAIGDSEVDDEPIRKYPTTTSCPLLETSVSMARKNLFDEADSGSEGVPDNAGGEDLKINEEYARRFEHNKKRDERQRRK